MVTQRVAIMSIRPEYAARIFSGEKRIELRRQRPSFVEGERDPPCLPLNHYTRGLSFPRSVKLVSTSNLT